MRVFFKKFLFLMRFFIVFFQIFVLKTKSECNFQVILDQSSAYVATLLETIATEENFYQTLATTKNYPEYPQWRYNRV